MKILLGYDMLVYSIYPFLSKSTINEKPIFARDLGSIEFHADQLMLTKNNISWKNVCTLHNSLPMLNVYFQSGICIFY